MKKVIMVHKEHGVYIGSFLGLGFWSKLDDAGQDQVPLFDSEKAAIDFVNTWEIQPESCNLLFPSIDVAVDDNFVSKEKVQQYW